MLPAERLIAGLREQIRLRSHEVIVGTDGDRVEVRVRGAATDRGVASAVRHAVSRIATTVVGKARLTIRADDGDLLIVVAV